MAESDTTKLHAGRRHGVDEPLVSPDVVRVRHVVVMVTLSVAVVVTVMIVVIIVVSVVPVI